MKSQDTFVEIGGLADLDVAALRQHWRELYHSEPPVRMSRELIIQSIAYRMQERLFGGLSRTARMKLMVAGSAAAAARRPRLRTQHRIKPGTRLLRGWQGQTHEVTATVDGRFFYRDRTYTSLSEIARRAFEWTMGQSSPAACSTNGPT